MGWTSRQVVLVVLSLLLVGCQGQPQPGSPTPTASNSGNPRFGISPGANILWEPEEQMLAELDLYEQVGFGWIRLDIDWHSIEPTPGAFDFSASDRVITAARQRGLRVLGMIAYTPDWAARIPGDAHSAPADPAAFAEFVSIVVDRYQPQGVNTWEIWNEPNSSLFWRPQPNVTQYANLLKAAATAIRERDPDAVILSGGLSPAADAANGSQISPLTFTRELLSQGAGDFFDVLSVHPYTYPLAADDPESSWWSSFPLQELRRATVAAGSPKPLWITEFGAPTGTDEAAVSPPRQAEILTSALAPRWPWLRRVFLYGGRDRGDDLGDREQNFGLVTTDFGDKPARAAVQDALQPR